MMLPYSTLRLTSSPHATTAAAHHQRLLLLVHVRVVLRWENVTKLNFCVKSDYCIHGSINIRNFYYYAAFTTQNHHETCLQKNFSLTQHEHSDMLSDKLNLRRALTW